MGVEEGQGHQSSGKGDESAAATHPAVVGRVQKDRKGPYPGQYRTSQESRPFRCRCRNGTGYSSPLAGRVQLTVRRLRRSGADIIYNKVYQILRSNGLVTASPAKSKQRKWVRYERLYSNAMWHTDWHTMKDPRMKGLNLITYLDDASRCVTGAALFEEATSENAVLVLRQAVGRFGVPATILSDNGSCFVGRGGRKKLTGSWMPTIFEQELLALDIALINSRPYHPQTNGKLERFHQSGDRDMALCQSCRLYRILQHRQVALGAGHRQLRDSDAGIPQQGRH